MNYADPELRDRLAAEYALGTLSGLARRRFERLLSFDRTLCSLVEEWELRLSPLAEGIRAVEPPAHLWNEIADRIAPAHVQAEAVQSAAAGQETPLPDTPAPGRSPVGASSRPGTPALESWFQTWLRRLWEDIAFWRGATTLAAGAAALLVFVALWRPSAVSERVAALDARLARMENTASSLAAIDERLVGLTRRIDVLASAEPTHVAVLLDKYQRPMMTADFDTAGGRLVLRLNLTPPRDFTANVLEVWMVAPDGAQHSLGLFPSERPGTTTALVLPHDTAEALVKASLAVSLEPRGGSATGQPSGPVLFTGPLVPAL